MEDSLYSVWNAVVEDFGTWFMTRINQGFKSFLRRWQYKERTDNPIFNPQEAATQRYIVAHTGKRVQGINNTTRQRLKSIIAQGIRSGAGTAEVAKMIRQQIPQLASRADMIARTEVVAASNYGARAAAIQSRVIKTKKWVNSGNDGRTRDTHLAIGGQKRALDKPYSNGLMYPGDPSGPASEVINCRCAEAYLYEDPPPDKDEGITKPIPQGEPVDNTNWWGLAAIGIGIVVMWMMNDADIKKDEQGRQKRTLETVKANQQKSLNGQKLMREHKDRYPNYTFEINNQEDLNNFHRILKRSPSEVLEQLMLGDTDLKPEDLHGMMFSDSDSGKVTVMIQLLDEDGVPQLIKRRTFTESDDGDILVYHDYFELDSKFRGTGVTPTLMRNWMDFYRSIGVDSVYMDANIDVGSYAWAKYGWKPTPESWKKLRTKLLSTYEQKLEGFGLPPEDLNNYKKILKGILENKDSTPEDIWRVADLPGVGKFLLTNQNWEGVFVVSNDTQAGRFDNYVSRKLSEFNLPESKINRNKEQRDFLVPIMRTEEQLLFGTQAGKPIEEKLPLPFAIHPGTKSEFLPENWRKVDFLKDSPDSFIENLGDVISESDLSAIEKEGYLGELKVPPEDKWDRILQADGSYKLVPPDHFELQINAYMKKFEDLDLIENYHGDIFEQAVVFEEESLVQEGLASSPQEAWGLIAENFLLSSVNSKQFLSDFGYAFETISITGKTDETDYQGLYGKGSFSLGSMAELTSQVFGFPLGFGDYGKRLMFGLEDVMDIGQAHASFHFTRSLDGPPLSTGEQALGLPSLAVEIKWPQASISFNLKSLHPGMHHTGAHQIEGLTIKVTNPEQEQLITRSFLRNLIMFGVAKGRGVNNFEAISDSKSKNLWMLGRSGFDIKPIDQERHATGDSVIATEDIFSSKPVVNYEKIFERIEYLYDHHEDDMSERTFDFLATLKSEDDIEERFRRIARIKDRITVDGEQVTMGEFLLRGLGGTTQLSIPVGKSKTGPDLIGVKVNHRIAIPTAVAKSILGLNQGGNFTQTELWGLLNPPDLPESGRRKELGDAINQVKDLRTTEAHAKFVKLYEDHKEIFRELAAEIYSKAKIDDTDELYYLAEEIENLDDEVFELGLTESNSKDVARRKFDNRLGKGVKAKRDTAHDEFLLEYGVAPDKFDPFKDGKPSNDPQIRAWLKWSDAQRDYLVGLDKVMQQELEKLRNHPKVKQRDELKAQKAKLQKQVAEAFHQALSSADSERGQLQSRVEGLAPNPKKEVVEFIKEIEGLLPKSVLDSINSFRGSGRIGQDSEKLIFTALPLSHGAEGLYNYLTKTVQVNPYPVKERQLRQVLWHELGHTLERANPKIYALAVGLLLSSPEGRDGHKQVGEMSYYMGRRYPGDADTEVVSMLLEEVFGEGEESDIWVKNPEFVGLLLYMLTDGIK